MDTSEYDAYNCEDTTRQSTDLSEFCDESILQQLLDEPFEERPDLTRLRTDNVYDGFDNNVGDTWIYPTNLSRRDYQFNICKTALYKNTLVVLPTGLGKTFIAAVIMYNYYRWYPRGKIIFMAPTRPLVSQQIEACYKIMGISPSDTIEMTGKQSPAIRSLLWKSKRVFFVTPQVVQSDMFAPESNFPVNEIKLIVIDEAHKAKGKYAYTEVVQNVNTRNSNFRVLALSATPGRGIEDVSEVVKNLLISQIEIRSETSIDVMPFTHRKNIKPIIIPLGPKLTRIKEDFINILDPYVRNLMDSNVITGNVDSLNKGWLVWQQKKYREMSLVQRHPNHSSICSDFSVCISMYHALELLIRQGVQSFLHFFDDQGNATEEKYFVAKDRRLKQFLNNLREEVGPNPYNVNDQTLPDGSIIDIPTDLDFGHPKFEILQKQLVDHFTQHPESKVIIFTEFRDTVSFIYRLLLQNRPSVKPRMIVGQGSSNNLRAVTQQEQMIVMRDFRNGVNNTLIATCVVEEGIDVGEVDLIVCFDLNSKNPTRFIQRIGRTGRKRQGKVLMLVTEGKEHETLKEILAVKDKINQKITKNSSILRNFYYKSKRLVPPEFNPKCMETFIKIPEIEDKEPPKKSLKKNNIAPEPKRQRKNEVAQTVTSGMKDMRYFFNKVNTIPESNPIIEPTTDVKLNSSMTSEMNTFNVSIGKDISDLGNIELPELDQVLHDKECPKSVKEILLRSNVDFIINKFELFAAIKDDSEPEAYIQLEKDLDMIRIIFGGDDNVEELKEIHRKRMRYATPPLPDEEEDEDKDENIISLEQDKKTETSPGSFHTQMDLRFFETTQHESRYQNQAPFGAGAKPTESPKTTNKLFVSVDVTPKTSKKRPSKAPVSSKSVKSMKDSPLLKAFERSMQSKNNFTSTPNIKGSQVVDKEVEDKEVEDKELAEVLAYFGLKNLMDIFDDDDDDVPDDRPNKPSTSRTCSENLTFKQKLDSTNLDDSEDVQIICPPQVPIISLDSCSEDDEIISKLPLTKKSIVIEGGAGSSLSNQTKIEDKIRIKSEKLFSDLCEDFNKSMTSISTEICMEVESQRKANETLYTISQIMDIAEGHAQASKLQKSKTEREPANLTKTKFDIGDIEDFYGASDDDMFADLTDVEKTRAIVVAAMESPEVNKENEIVNGCVARKISSDLFDSKNCTALELEANMNRLLSSPQKKLSTSTKLNNTPSPSLLSRKLNFSKLKQYQKMASPVKSVDSSPSSNFMSCNSRLDSPKENNPRLEVIKETISSEDIPEFNPTESLDMSRFKFTQPKTPYIGSQTQNDVSVIPGVARRTKRIIESSSSSNNDSDSDDFATCKTAIPSKQKKKVLKRPRKPVKKRKCMFLDNEAGVSGNEVSSDEDELESSFLDDTMIQREDENEGLDIRAQYLQSIRSPLKNRGTFKIPALKKSFNYDDIFSQPVAEESMSVYKEDSFVVDEGDIVSSESEEELTELERAEAILKERKRKRRLGIDEDTVESVKYKKRRRKIKVCVSDDEEEELKLFRKQIKSEH